MWYCFNFEGEADPSRWKKYYSNSQVLEFIIRVGVRRPHNGKNDMSMEKVATEKKKTGEV